VEVTVASFVLLVGVLGAMSLLDVASVHTGLTKQREGATALGRELVEEVRAVPYGRLNANTVAPSLQAQPGLADSNTGGGGWSVNRRGTSYSIDARTCTVDDPKDGVGANETGDFCRIDTSASCNDAIAASGGAGSGTTDVRLCLTLGGTTISTLCGALQTGATGTIGGVVGGIGAGGSASVCGSTTTLDANPDDYKLVLFTVSWANGGHRVKNATVVPNPGQGAGPAVKSLVAIGLTGDVITGVATSQSFSLTTSVAPASVQWSIDGAIQGSATGIGTAWTFVWPTGGLVDGSYVVGARAFDQTGQAGIAATRTVTINRGPPPAPTGFVAGRNGTALEFEWDGNRARDIAGYKVFQKVTGGTDVVLCDLASDTSCVDTTPPSTDPLDAYVVAYDRDSTTGELRAGAQSSVVTVTSSNRAPFAPRLLTASSSGPSTILNWLAPIPADPDLGDTIAFYRVYRDGTTVADRYDKATCSGVTCSWTDTRTEGGSHTYRVTAVDDNLAESPFAGPVTR
jgi:Tfp pilus assembly protein PilV